MGGINMFTDSHCHLFYEDYEDIEKIIDNAKKNGIIKMINNGSDLKTNKEVLEIASKYSEVFASLGFHPEICTNTNITDLSIITKNIDKIVAIGEIGLDYHYDNTDKDKQIWLFQEQLKIAEKYNKPVIIHSRDATKDTIDILQKYPNVKGVIHCFSGSLETAKIYIKMGYKLGIGGVITFKNSKLHEVIEQLPLESIVLETDAPYLTPHPHRGEKNEPAYTKLVAEYISNLKGISMQELSKITENTIKEVFDI